MQSAVEIEQIALEKKSETFYQNGHHVNELNQQNRKIILKCQKALDGLIFTRNLRNIIWT